MCGKMSSTIVEICEVTRHDSPKSVGWDGRRNKVWTSQSSHTILMTAKCVGKWSSASWTVQRLSLFSSLREQMLWASCCWFPEFAHRGKSIRIPAVMGLDGEMRVMMIMMMRRNLWDSYDLNWLRLWSCFIFWLRVLKIVFCFTPLALDTSVF